VTDLERSVAFYRDLLGLREATRFTLLDETLVFLAAGQGWVELIDDQRGPRADGVVDHLALRVDDLDTLLPRLRAAHVRLLDDAPLDVPAISARIVFVLGPDGERVELIERPGDIGS
jgi:catechol 2,3-dioxygenase-like lactoylglutathione lyase family enzyme